MKAYKLCMVQDGSVEYPETNFRNPCDAARILRDHLGHADREIFAVIACNSKNKLVGIHTVAIGSLDTALVTPREVFKFAILSNAASIILAHNHPSGDTTPSPNDAALTKRLKESAEILGIDILDHIILGHEYNYLSFKEEGLL